MTIFNRLISFFAITAVMLAGVLAIHSIKVDTLPIDYALGLISKNRDPIFTIRARAQDCTGQCATEKTLQEQRAEIKMIEERRLANAKILGGILATIQATTKYILSIINTVSKALSWFIGLLQNARNINIMSIISAVRYSSLTDNPFQKEFDQINKEFEDAKKTYDKDIEKANKNIKEGAEQAKKVSEIWDSCIAARLAQEKNQAPQGVDINKLCGIAVESGTNLTAALRSGTAASGSTSRIFSNTQTSQTGNSDALKQALDGNATYTFSEPLNFLFNNDPDTLKYKNIDTENKLIIATNKVRNQAEANLAEAKQKTEWTTGCGLIVSEASKESQDYKKNTLNNSPVKQGVFSVSAANTPILSTSPSVPSSLTATLTSKDTSSTSNPFLPSNLTAGAIPKEANYSFDFAKADQLDLKALKPDVCAATKSSTDILQKSVDKASEPTFTNETDGAMAVMMAKINEIMFYVDKVLEILQTILSSIQQIMTALSGLSSQFTAFFSSFTNMFNSEGGGGSAGLTKAINDSLGNGTLVPPGGGSSKAGTPNKIGVPDDGSVIISISSILTDVNATARYVDDGVDCILNDVKYQANSNSLNYNLSGNNFDTSKLPQVGYSNLNTYSNGSNVPDGIMGASVTDQNTPPITNIKYSKVSGDIGFVPSTPPRSLISSGSTTGNINPTYHQCQSSPWGDDNSNAIAAQRLSNYQFDPKYGGPSAYRDGVTNDWRVVNNAMNKTIPDQCYLSNNNLTRSEKESIISSLGINTNFAVINLQDNDSQFDSFWNQAKSQLDEAQRTGQVRWDTDSSLITQNRVRSGVVIGSGSNKKEIQIKPGACEVSYTKDQVNTALQARGFNTSSPTVLSFAALVK